MMYELYTLPLMNVLVESYLSYNVPKQAPTPKYEASNLSKKNKRVQTVYIENRKFLWSNLYPLGKLRIECTLVSY